MQADACIWFARVRDAALNGVGYAKQNGLVTAWVRIGLGDRTALYFVMILLSDYLRDFIRALKSIVIGIYRFKFNSGNNNSELYETIQMCISVCKNQ